MVDLKGKTPETWLCVDCGMNTAPGCSTRAELELAFAIGKPSVQRFGSDTEVYTVQAKVWKRAGMKPYGGCLCVGCLEKRIGRRLKPSDFDDHVFNAMPGTDRLLSRRGWRPPLSLAIVKIVELLEG
jgi:hypothetical protein